MKAKVIKNIELTAFWGFNGHNKCVYTRCDILADNGKGFTIYLELDSVYYRKRYYALKSSNDIVPLSKRVLRLIRRKLTNDFEISRNAYNYLFVRGAVVIDRNKEFVK